MPPPPPPSKSYLLKFDTSSDEEVEDPPVYHDNTSSNQFSPMNFSFANDDTDETLCRDPQSTMNHAGSFITNGDNEQLHIRLNDQSKNRKKKKKKKKKKPSKSSSPLEVQKKVTFGKVKVRELYRDIHSDGVPMDGGWPLGLGSNIHRQYSTNVDTFEQHKQIELVNRYKKYVHEKRHDRIYSSCKSSRRKRSNSKGGEELRKFEEQKEKMEEYDALSVYIPESFVFETRPFDYKRSNYTPSFVKNGVFGQDPMLEWKEIKAMGRNVLFRPLVEAERKDLLLRDASSHFHLPMPSSAPPSSTAVLSLLQKDGSPSPSKYRSRGDSVTWSEDDTTYCSSAVNQIRNELEQIRIHRSPDMSTGCSCRKLVGILPKNIVVSGGGKRTHHHRRMQERKVKEELRKRHVPFTSSATREELEQLLYDTVEERGCCTDKDCECYRNGIMCHADTCSCWNPSHNSTSGSHKRGEDNVVLSNEVIRQNCGNNNGIYVVDFDEIQKHRDQYINSVQDGLCSYIQS